MTKCDVICFVWTVRLSTLFAFWSGGFVCEHVGAVPDGAADAAAAWPAVCATWPRNTVGATKASAAAGNKAKLAAASFIPTIAKGRCRLYESKLVAV
eukprot:3897810-Amphidinium_carterae.1